MGFICISSKIHEVSDPDNYNIDDKDNQSELYGFIDWWKQGHTEKERDENLEQELKDSGYLFFKARGMFEGLAESSFIVMPLKPSIDKGEDDSGFDYENFDDLKDFGQSLTSKYSQYKEDLIKRKFILKKSKHIPSYDFSEEMEEFFESVYHGFILW